MLSVRAPDTQETTALTVTTQGPAERQALAKEVQEPAGVDLWKFETMEDGVAYLRMPGWALYRSKWDWKAFLDRGMDELIDRHAPGLIVDLRDNEGGLDVGNVLLERIVAREVQARSLLLFTRYRKMPDDLAPYLDTWDRSFLDWGDQAVPDRAGFFRLGRFDDTPKGDQIRPRGRRFEGRLVVLVNAANSSATFQFAKLVKDNKLGTLVGQPTGGNQRGINGGAFFFARLPHSRIEFDLPLIATFPGDAPLPDGVTIPFRDLPNAGVDPDVLVLPSINDIAAGMDRPLQAARSIARDGK